MALLEGLNREAPYIHRYIQCWKKEPGHGHNDFGYNYKKSFFLLIKDINFGDIKNSMQTKWI